MEKQLVYTIHQREQRAVEMRGIVLPLFDGIATLGLSLIMELQSMNVDLPIEVPHCGDLKQSVQNTTSLLDCSHKVFCQYLRDCHRRYRCFDFKLLAVIFSQFEEIMLLDADTLFFKVPCRFGTRKNTGALTLFSSTTD
ncbi:hypothetical protein PsorP6_012095 [Peronosclerospora sorghi]|uniref:Uncharacterized protein n=1 Tax=Peronosclerospora sorghi TaxID=230839 RepID=A0ACC0WK60_9STRA|nr:hypothetical protein PsorP6_012095 [Peronosclerospora sorghi]